MGKRMTEEEKKIAKLEKKVQQLHDELAEGADLREHLVEKAQEERKNWAEEKARYEAAVRDARYTLLNYTQRMANAAGFLLIVFNRYLSPNTPAEFKATMMQALGLTTEVKLVGYEKRDGGFDVSGELEKVKE